MRLSDHDRRLIKETAKEIFGPRVKVRLFGSRINDDKRGGDIDLLIESDWVIPDQERKSLTFVARLQMRLGDQPVDVVVIDPAVSILPIHEHAKRTGGLL